VAAMGRYTRGSVRGSGEVVPKVTSRQATGVMSNGRAQGSAVATRRSGIPGERTHRGRGAAPACKGKED
jgi:hypothetical protein